MAFQDKTLTCIDCGQQFVFTSGEQEFYEQKGFMNEPKRCRSCKAVRKGMGGHGGPRQEYDVICSACGQQTTVPFKPILDKPVFCKPCFVAKRSAVAGDAQI